MLMLGWGGGGWGCTLFKPEALTDELLSCQTTWKTVVFCNGILVQREVVFISFVPNDILTSAKRIFISVAKHYSTRRGQRPFGTSTHTHTHTDFKQYFHFKCLAIFVHGGKVEFGWHRVFNSALYQMSESHSRAASQHNRLLRLGHYLSLFQSKCWGNEARK